MAAEFFSNLSCLECCGQIHSSQVQKFCGKCGLELYVYACDMCSLPIRHDENKRPDSFCVHCGQPQNSDKATNSLSRMTLVDAHFYLRDWDEAKSTRKTLPKTPMGDSILIATPSAKDKAKAARKTLPKKPIEPTKRSQAKKETLEKTTPKKSNLSMEDSIPMATPSAKDKAKAVSKTLPKTPMEATKRSQAKKERVGKPTPKKSDTLMEDSIPIPTPSAKGVTKLYSCPQCDDTFTRRDTVLEHAEKVHYPGQYSCIYCSHVCATWRHLTNHFRSKHHDMPAVRREDVKNEATIDPAMVVTKDMIKETVIDVNSAGDGPNTPFSKSKKTPSTKSKRGKRDEEREDIDLAKTGDVMKSLVMENGKQEPSPVVPQKKRRMSTKVDAPLSSSRSSSSSSSSNSSSTDSDDDNTEQRQLPTVVSSEKTRASVEGVKRKNQDDGEVSQAKGQSQLLWGENTEEDTEKETSFPCSSCGKEFPTEAKSKRHFKRQHGAGES